MKKLVILLPLLLLGLTACGNTNKEEEIVDYSIKPLTVYNEKQITRGNYSKEFLTEISTIGTKYDYLAIQVCWPTKDSNQDFIILDYNDKDYIGPVHEVNDKHETTRLELTCFSQSYYNTSSCQNKLNRALEEKYYNGGCGNFKSQLYTNSYGEPLETNWRNADYGEGVYILEDVEVVNFVEPIAHGYIPHPSDGYTPTYNETCWWYMFSILTYKDVYKLTWHNLEWHVLPEN